MKKSKVIYSAWFGEKGNCFEPKVITEGWDYIFLTDHKELLKRKTEWNVIYKPSVIADTELAAKFYKINYNFCFADYNYSIYIDSDKYIIDCNLDNVLDCLNEGSILAALKHRYTDCTYKEIKRQKHKYKDSVENFRRIRIRNLKAGIEVKSGLCDNSLLIRKHTPELAEAMDKWWYEVLNYCKRDQCSLMMILKKYNIPFNYLTYIGYKNYYLKRKLKRIIKK